MGKASIDKYCLFGLKSYEERGLTFLVLKSYSSRCIETWAAQVTIQVTTWGLIISSNGSKVHSSMQLLICKG